MNHRKQKHLFAVAACQNNLNNKCRWSSEVCWWKHESKDSNAETPCFNCQKTFKTKGEMMLHRKKDHKSTVKMCSNFQQSRCRWSTSFCWFLHEEETMDIEYNFDEKVHQIKENENKNEKVDENLKSVFQKDNKIPIIK